MKNEGWGGGVGGGLKRVWSRGNRYLFVFYVAIVFYINVFSFSVCKAQLISNWSKNRQGAPKCLVRFLKQILLARQ
jgi:hypothetical protein